jgi:hypothetical protein
MGEQLDWGVPMFEVTRPGPVSNMTRHSHSRVFAAAASAGIHLVAIAALAMSLSAVAPLRLDEHRSTGLPLIATAFLIEEPTPELAFTVAPKSSTQPDDAIAAERVPLPPITPVAVDSFETSQEATDIGDAEEIARLQGLYVRQINARFERILEEEWPAHHVGVPCRVRVAQDEVGYVQLITFDACELPAGQQRVLERVIRRSSPLPRPPAGLAMGSYLTLDLSALLSP